MTGPTLSALALLALLGLSASCGGGSSLAPGSVGAPCDSAQACTGSETRYCITGWPGGYCTEFACSPGSCADGSVCSAAGSMSAMVCLASCHVTTDCRTNYLCNAISSEVSVCVPQNP
jgi:hypothetical protein